MITLSKAKQALEASEAKARELGIAVSTAIVDDHGTLLAMSKMDGSLVISPRFAQTKAFTSAVLMSPTAGLAEYAKEGNPYYGICDIFGGEITPIAGGLPVKHGEKVIGGVGVGGSMNPADDATCAEEAVKVLQS
jgi:uncharacterized protein GlcG (DUF336 family)